MPKRYRLRRKRYGKRRRYNPRKSVGFRVSKIVSKQVEGARTFYNESRKDAIEGTANQVTWQAFCAAGDRNHIEGIIKAVNTGTPTYTGIGETDIGAYESNLGHYKVDVSNMKITFHFRNIDQHPTMFTIFEIMAKRTRGYPSAHAAICTMAVSDLHTGWQRFATTGSTSSTVKSGDYAAGTLSSTVITTHSAGLGVHHSEEFMNNYRVVKSKKYKLSPGDDVYWTMRLRNRVWNPEKIYNQLSEGDDTIDEIANYTKCLLVKMHGCIGRSNVLGAADTIGFLQTDVSMDYVETCRLYPLISAKSEKYTYVGHDDMTGITLVGPNVSDLVDDSN